MKHPFYISLLLGCLLGWAACTGPVIIEEGDNDINVNVDNNEGENESPIVWEPVPIVHEGTYASPYSIAEAQTLGRGKSVWIEGYIVGSVSGSMKNGCDYTAENAVASNVLLADAFPTGSEYDHLFCMPVELPNGSIERDDLNLYDNPNNYHRKLRIEGDITQYYKVAGIKNITGYTFGDEEDEDENENDNDNEDIEKEEDTTEKPEEPNDPNATRKDTLTIAEGIKIQNKGEQPYIKGYIIGFYNGSSIVFNPTTEQISSRAQYNVVLADNIKETDWRNVIIVELTKKTALQRDINLKDNPQNLYRLLTVKGMLREYNDDTGYHGCMDTESAYKDIEDYYFAIE